MKKLLKTSLTALLIFATVPMVPMGCTPAAKTALSALPDIANFTITAVSTFVKGASTLISVATSTLGNGTFTVNYNLTGANIMTGLTATLTVNGNTGTFSTPVLTGSGQTNVVITSISNSSGSSSFSSPPSYAFSDSAGLMTATINGASYRSTFVQATLPGGSGAMLTIHATKWTPLTTITLYVENYTGPTVMNFYNPSDFAGGASYGAPGVAQLGAHGTVTVTQNSPLIVGTFTFTNEDSSVVTGSFSCPHP